MKTSKDNNDLIAEGTKSKIKLVTASFFSSFLLCGSILLPSSEAFASNASAKTTDVRSGEYFSYLVKHEKKKKKNKKRNKKRNYEDNDSNSSNDSDSVDGYSNLGGSHGKVKKNTSDSWTSYGGNIHNTGYADSGDINAQNVDELEVDWVYQTTDDGSIGIVPTPPAAKNGVLYFTSFDDGFISGSMTGDYRGNGAIHAVNAFTGQRIWKQNISDYSDLSGCGDDNSSTPCRDLEYSRNTPAIWGKYLVVGTQNNRWENMDDNGNSIGLNLPGLGAYALVINRFNGKLVHAVKLDDAPFANVTQSPIIHAGIAYVSTSSLENAQIADRFDYECCKHIGTVSAINLKSGKIIWQTSTVPGGYKPYAERIAQSYSGASSWGNTAVIDLKRNRLYVTTGNNYNVPDVVDECAATSIANTPDDLGGGIYAFASSFEDDCNHICTDPNTGDEIQVLPGETCPGLKESDNHPDSIIAMNLKTGEIDWAFSGGKYDPMTISCSLSLYGISGPINDMFNIFNSENCSSPFKGPDNDFSQGVTFVKNIKINGKKTDMLIAGQKSGTYWAIDADTKQLIWRRDVDTIFDSFITSGLPLTLGGGSGWSSSTDGEKVYVVEEFRKQALITFALLNNFPQFWGNNISFQNLEIGRILPQIDPLLKAAPDSLDYSMSGYWYALDIKSGDIVWQHAPNEEEWKFIDENQDLIDDREAAGITVLRAMLQAGTVVSNGVVYGAAMDPRGTFRAFDAETGEQLWKYEVINYINNVLGNPQKHVVVNTPPTLVYNRVYWGVGYTPRVFHVDLRTQIPMSNLLFSFKLSSDHGSSSASSDSSSDSSS